MVPGQSFVSQAWPQDQAGKGELRSLVPGLFFLRYETFFLKKKMHLLLSSLGHAFIEYTPEKKNKLVNHCIAFLSQVGMSPFHRQKYMNMWLGTICLRTDRKKLYWKMLVPVVFLDARFPKQHLQRKGDARLQPDICWELSMGVKCLSCFCLC